jgi:hypothetical protein
MQDESSSSALDRQRGVPDGRALGPTAGAGRPAMIE